MRFAIPIILICLLATGCADKKPPVFPENPKVLFEGGWKLFDSTVYTKFTYFPSDTNEQFELRWIESGNDNKCMEFIERWNGPFKESDLPDLTFQDNKTDFRDLFTYLKKPAKGFATDCDKKFTDVSELNQKEWEKFYYFSSASIQANYPYGQFDIVKLEEIKNLKIDPFYFGSANIVFHTSEKLSPVMNIVNKNISAIYIAKNMLLKPKMTVGDYKIGPLASHVNPTTLVVLMDDQDRNYAEVNFISKIHIQRLSNEFDEFCYRTQKTYRIQQEAILQLVSDVVSAIRVNDLNGLNTQYEFLKTNQGPNICNP